MPKITSFILGILISFCSVAQVNSSTMEENERNLIKEIDEVRSCATFEEMLEKNMRFEASLRKVLRNDKSYSFAFDSLSRKMCTLKSPDGKFRLFNWNLEVPRTEEQYYFCLIMKYDERSDDYVIIELFDKSKLARNVKFSQYTERNWYGALYYKIVPVQKGLKTIYTLLAWDGNDKMSNSKIIESMAFSGKNHAKFGFPLFEMDDSKAQRRVIFQHMEQAHMSLRHQKIKKKDYLIFDHLSPTSPNLEGMYEFYAPDMSYDAYMWDDGKWNYIKDYKAKNPRNSKDHMYNAPPKERKP